jgi:hypothetical protein
MDSHIGTRFAELMAVGEVFDRGDAEPGDGHSILPHLLAGPSASILRPEPSTTKARPHCPDNQPCAITTLPK